MKSMNDPLWPHFEPLWNDLSELGSGLLIAGGYGLFLKQSWLFSEKQAQNVIPLERWLNATPRVTKDLDLIVGLDLIADEASNGQVLETLRKHGFSVSPNPQGQRWQFEKELGVGRKIVAELHAETPTADETRLKTDRIRVKHTPSLGKDGVHGRHNPEAVGCDLAPFEFSIGETKISVPNPVTWTIMKLTAADERWSRSQENSLDLRERSFSRDQAIKHAHDACRAVAMMTIRERDASSMVIDSIRETSQFQRTMEIYAKSLRGNDGWANNALQDYWLADDLETIRLAFSQFFSSFE